MIVCKFGGSSLVNKKSIQNIHFLSKRNKKMVFVFSAIGKQNKKDTKLTDLLIEYTKSQNKNTLEQIYNKFKKLNKILKLDFDYSKHINNYINEYSKTKDYDLFISRGEFLTTYMYSLYLGLYFVPAEKLIISKNGKIDYNLLTQKLNYYLKYHKKIAVPGFYYLHDNKIKLFGRGGSDLSGAILSKAYKNTIYENWTDVKGIREVNPKIVHSKQITKLDYNTLSFMCGYDTNVIQQDCAKELINSTTILKVNSIFDLKNQPTIVKNKKTKNVSFIITKQLDKLTIIAIKISSFPIMQIFYCKNNFKKNIKMIYKKFLLKK